MYSGDILPAWQRVVHEEVDGADLEDGEAAQEITRPPVPKQEAINPAILPPMSNPDNNMLRLINYLH